MEKELPENWIKTELGKITTKPKYGWTSKASGSGNVKYLRTTDLSKGKIDWETVPYCIEIPAEVQNYQIEKDDILISRAGSVGLSYRIEESPPETVFASYLIRFKPIKVLPRLVEFYLKSPSYWKSISSVSAGIAIQNINATKLAELVFPLPPLPEQNRIVAKLDRLFAQLEGINASLDKIPVLLKNFRQQVLTQAVTGKLLSKEAFTTIGALDIEIKTGPFGSTLHKSEYIENSIPVINPSHIKDGVIYPDNSITISRKKAQELHRWILEPGDIIMGRRGEMGRAALYKKEYGEMVCGTGSLILRPSKKIEPEFLAYYLRSQFCVNFLGSNSVGTTMINLNQKIIKSLPFPKLSFKEQTESIKHLFELLEKVDDLEKKYLKLKNKIINLPQALLHKAFKGELVPQMESDGNARELLEEIQGLKKKVLYKI